MLNEKATSVSVLKPINSQTYYEQSDFLNLRKNENDD
jgi:hypothetical protein